MWSRGLSWAVVVSLLIGSAAARAQQKSFSQTPINSQAYDYGLFNPVEDLSKLSETEFTTLKHPAFPQHGVRIKKTSFCDTTVQSYTGYVDTGTRHLFFYFFESRNNPDKDDVILWTNGGPGCSSSIGLFLELGPCSISDSTGPKFNPESWNSNANILFLDQPVGVGYSYADFGESVSTTEDAANDVVAFISTMFLHCSKFKGRPFHLAGESYGGHYLPIFGAAVYDQNAKLVDAGLAPINLTSIMIGNGLTDFTTLIPSFYDIACTPVSFPPVLDISTCVGMKAALPRCKKWMKSGCLDHFDLIDCAAAITFCFQSLEDPFFASNRNPYDISRPCEGDVAETLCYPVTKQVSSYLNRPDVRTLLGVDSAVPGNLTLCSNKVLTDFANTLDEFHSTKDYVAGLLDRNIDVLIYVGTLDFICNFVGNEAWTLQFEWSGHEEFSTQPLREWKVDGEVVGSTRNARGLTFATITGAGHMVPHDKPKVALELVNKWLKKEAL